MRMDPITAYLNIAAQRQEEGLFAPSEACPLVLEEEDLRRFAAETGLEVGEVFRNSDGKNHYFSVLADVCRGKNGRFFRYARVVSPHPSDGVVVIPTRRGKLGLIELFRHAPRQMSVEFVRGFAEHMTPQENAAKELREEISALLPPEAFTFLGTVRSNTGLSAGAIAVFTAEVEDAFIPAGNEECIENLLWLTEEEFLAAAAEDRITCGITLAAYLKYRARKGGVAR